MPRRRLRILVVATNTWTSIGQLVSALVKVGFEVAVICPPNSPIIHIRNLKARYRYRPAQSLTSIKRAISDWSPYLLIANDDEAIRELHSIHHQARGETDVLNNSLAELIERSLGDFHSFATSRSKSYIISLANQLEIACPPTITVTDLNSLKSHVDKFAYPVVIKLDQSWGGRGVRLASNPRELLRVAFELTQPLERSQFVKSLAARALQRFPGRWRPELPQTVSIQQYVEGRPANRAVVCWEGKVLAGISVEALETTSEFGTTTLAKIINHGELADASEKIVANQKLSGFLGFDFILDRNGRAWFLEMNPRTTPACHLRFGGPSLAASLFIKLEGKLPNSDVREVPHDTIALFPNGTARKRSIDNYFEDLPEEEPAFVESCLKSAFLKRATQKVRDLISNLLNRNENNILLPVETNDHSA